MSAGRSDRVLPERETSEDSGVEYAVTLEWVRVVAGRELGVDVAYFRGWKGKIRPLLLEGIHIVAGRGGFSRWRRRCLLLLQEKK